MIRVTATPDYDRQWASKFRRDPCVRWCGRRVRHLVMAAAIAPRVGLRPADLLDLEAGQYQTDDAGWGALHAALDAVLAERRAA